MDELLIIAKSLFKSYGDVIAVSGISFSLKKGEVLGVVGPNGAGKTTTIGMITGRCLIDKGELYVVGKDVKTHDRDIRKVMGVVSQDDNADPDLNVYETLLIYASYFGKPSKERINELLNFFELEHYKTFNVMSLSGGMRRRLSIARALINDPLLLILDEPTTGLDPQARYHTWDRLLRIKEQGVTILLTTHYMEEVTKLCDRVMIIDKGKILAIDKPQDIIISRYPSDVIEIKIQDKDSFNGIIKNLDNFGLKHEFTGKFGLIIPFKNEDALAIEKYLLESYPRAYPLRRPPNLEDAFLSMTGKELMENNL
ncbi:MAG: ABC transporter ATP-binding protein [Deltaproteobacteria bacterium]|nr:ABC transporter ATP-binding protein [Deltaproteobacteria bacterium]MCL5792105.1 ABC transporter ATP-binding protein [Deltaproteobacteria bacterium]